METDKRHGGWLQVNNTVVPYLERHTSNGDHARFAPLDVIRYGAGLLRDKHVNSSEAIETECQFLTQKCAEVKLNFKFSHIDGVELVDVRDVWNLCHGKLVVRELPDENPFEHTRAVSDDTMLTLTSQSSTTLVPVESPLLNDSIKAEIFDKRTESNAQKGPSLDAVIDLTQTRPGCRLGISEPQGPFVDCAEKAQNEPLDLSIKTHVGLQTRPRVRTSIGVSNAAQKSVVHVAPVRLFGRKIPCIVKKGVQYVLVETLRRAYFPQCSLRAFMFMVNRSISPFVYDLEQEDIDAIMSVSKNPTSLNKSSKVISMHDAGEILPMFRAFLKKVSQQRQERKSGSTGSPAMPSNALDVNIQHAGYAAPSGVPETMQPRASVEQMQNGQDSDCILMSEFHTPFGLIQCGDILSGKHETIQSENNVIVGQHGADLSGPVNKHPTVTASAGIAGEQATPSPGVSSKRGRQRSLQAALARLQHSKESAS